MPTYYNNIKKVTSNLLDGGLSLAATGARPSILVCGPAKQGLTEVPQLCVDATDVVRFFGEDTVLEKKVAEIIAQAGSEAFFIYCMRVGGEAPTVTLTDDSNGSVLTIKPLNYKDAEATDRLALVMVPHDSDEDGVYDQQRFLLWDIEEESVVFDSHSIIPTGEVLFEVDLTLNGSASDFEGATGYYQHAWDITTGSIIVADLVPLIDSSLTSATLTDSVTGDAITVAITKAGNDGESVPLMQRYVFLARALEDLAFNEFDYILPVGSYFLDVPNAADHTDDGTPSGKILHHENVSATAVYPIADLDFSSISALTSASGSAYGPEERVPPRVASATQTDVLGWLWQTNYAQKTYYYFAKAKGWDLFEPDSDEVVITVNDDVANLVLDDALSNQHTYQITFGAGFAAASATSLEFQFDATIDLVNSAVTSGSAPSVVYKIGTQDTPSMNDIKTKLESDLNSQIAAALSATGTLVSVSTALSSGNEFLSINGTPQHSSSDFNSGAFTPQVAGSLTIGFEFTSDAVSVTINKISGNTSSINETAGALVIEIADGDTLADLNGFITAHTGTEITVTGSNLTNGSAVTQNLETSISGGSVVTSFGVAHTTSFADNYLDHQELTGEAIPAVVQTRFESAKAAEFRECSFAHLIGTYCHKSSTVWKTTMSCMSVQPSSTAPISKKTSIGTGPEYTSISGDLAIDSVADGGTGLLGYKFLAGAPSYRDKLLSKAANSSDGFAYGGLILTEGNNLPKGTEPYGVDDNDEAKDERGFGIDIGKYIVPCGMWVTHNNAIGAYKGSLTGLITGKIGVTPMGEEPIGIVNGRVSNIIGGLMRIEYPYSSIDELSGAGYATVIFRPTRGGVTYINNIRTLAHRNSDYRKLSTIRSVNMVVQGIRDLAEDYIGLAYNSSNVASLRTAVNGYLRAQQQVGVHNGAVAQISFNQQDRILGNINIRLTMVPPFAIESITVTTSLVADQSSL